MENKNNNLNSVYKSKSDSVINYHTANKRISQIIDQDKFQEDGFPSQKGLHKFNQRMSRKMQSSDENNNTNESEETNVKPETTSEMNSPTDRIISNPHTSNQLIGLGRSKSTRY